MYRTKNVLHCSFNGSDPVGQVVPVTIFISSEADLEWFNVTAPDPTYLEQIVDLLQGPDEWPALLAQVLALDQPPTKKADVSARTEHVLPHIKFTYEVRRNARGYNMLLSRSKTCFAPRPMASFEVVVWCVPKRSSVSAHPIASAKLPTPPSLSNLISIDND
ncbi:hypothetical protein H257_02512 [Aphanomyces astaci]|uniref:Uncharacterized protein n=1 Tax=Aphanomyces astaci TaxID=112090 RepID=W4H436_APHAT|nr:hypothetical protein H257_02512 [Aphanomyces astaci]ETV86024.1 hypothetical protein H257_02512 [Aphanomyces astaci]|eukprot:XP_009824496.1 hypothetical protein H257_02512 [Aphanomyces astaci]